MRFRYPVSLPEDVAEALGVKMSNFLTFNKLLEHLTSNHCCPKRLTKYMPREIAEEAFLKAPRKEHFQKNTLFAYHFCEGWLEFSLHFDDESRLRRIYLQHKQIANNNGIEIPLCDN